MTTRDPRLAMYPVGKDPGLRQKINMAAASQTLKAEQSGQIFVGVVDAVFTLPAASADIKGVYFTVVCGALSTGTGLSISPNAVDNIYGNALSAVDDKDLINTGASDVVGDSATVICDGVNWLILNVTGTWAKEA